ncbi:MAG: hypothetical protein IKY91_00750 [Akkermansia sp.]|nr:hypothetical protein [Akkermansia sp.]
MKRTIFIAAVLSSLISTTQADDITLTEGNIDYTNKAVTSSSKDGKVLGGALSSDGAVSISEAGSIIFAGNTAHNSYTSSNHTTADVDLAAGGAIYGAAISISGTGGDITFNENIIRAKTTNDARTRVRGGAIKGGTVSITDNTEGLITFTGNIAYDEYKAYDSTVGAQVDKPRFSYGGAIYADTAMPLSGNGAINFTGNEAGRGGAISAGYGSTMMLADNGALSFSGNVAEYGGAAYNGAYIYKNSTNTAGSATLSITGNDGVSFIGNSARQNGGAIYNQTNSTLSISNNLGDVIFSGNKATLYGGAIRGQSSSTVELNGNAGSVSFTGNSVTLQDKTNVYGGAISVDKNSTVSINNNGSVTISNNTAQTNSSAYGGAIAVYNSTLSIIGNTNGVTIDGNSVVATNTSASGIVSAEGGAVYGKSLYVQGNSGTVSVQNNTAQAVNNGTAKGGAVYVTDTLAITGNDKVEFRGNVQQSSNQTILRSVYLDSKSKTGDLQLSAAAGGSITFYDSLYAAPNSSTYSLSADLNAESGNTGSIVFSGKYAELDLLTKHAGATIDEIALSRTSTIQSNITLHQGTLAVESQAVLQSNGLTIASPATLSLQSGTVEMLNNTSLTLSGKSTMLASGSNVISANTLTFADGSTFNLSFSQDNYENALFTLNTTSLTYGDAVVNFLGMDKLQDGEYLLLDLKGSEALGNQVWSTEGISISGLGLGDSFEWRDNGTSLYLVHTIIPEPTTATFSLLALVGLAARRRRK